MAHKVVEAHIRPVLVVVWVLLLCLLVVERKKKNDVYQTVYFLLYSLFISSFCLFSRRTPHTLILGKLLSLILLGLKFFILNVRNYIGHT